MGILLRNEKRLTMPARTPEDCDRLFSEYVNAGELEEVLALYEEDGRFVQRDGGVATGRVEICKAIARLVAMRPILRSEVVKVVKAGEDLAVLYNDWSMSAKGRDGELIERAGKAIEVVRRQPDGTWLFAIDDPYGRG
jgi:uncharacterized protein (TIGR02246 family)